ncbi:alpha/beta hydrolase-fold protein [Alteromonadaceae bacterium BrNp21-10]|nr:alpha/beta hydrolase-fold protein [Alteromonadaceae bacterium BrNp21-10]
MSKTLSVLMLLCVLLAGCNDPKVDEQNSEQNPELNSDQQPEQKPWVWGDHLKADQYSGKQQFQSTITGVDYPYHVYLPVSYAENPDKHYAIMYVMDGQWNFEGFANYIEQDKRDVIIVGVEEGPKGSDRRSIDYRLPGAITYLQFIREEFMPLIESNYRVDANERSFQGTSFGGLVTTALLFVDDAEKPLFKNYIAYDTSYWDNPLAMDELIEQRLKINSSIESNLYLTTAFPLGNFFFVMGFIDQLEKLAIPGLNIDHEWYLVTHNGVAGASMEDTLDKIYGEIE